MSDKRYYVNYDTWPAVPVFPLGLGVAQEQFYVFSELPKGLQTLGSCFDRLSFGLEDLMTISLD